MKAYSLDLRQKMIERYAAGVVTQRELAKQFGVSTFFVVKVLGLYRRGESLAAKRRGGYRKPQLSPPMREFVKEQLAAQNNLTLCELCERVAREFKVRVSAPTMCRTLQQLNLKRKKRVSSRPSETLNG